MRAEPMDSERCVSMASELGVLGAAELREAATKSGQWLLKNQKKTLVGGVRGEVHTQFLLFLLGPGGKQHSVSNSVLFFSESLEKSKKRLPSCNMRLARQIICTFPALGCSKLCSQLCWLWLAVITVPGMNISGRLWAVVEAFQGTKGLPPSHAMSCSLNLYWLA